MDVKENKKDDEIQSTKEEDLKEGDSKSYIPHESYFLPLHFS